GGRGHRARRPGLGAPALRPGDGDGRRVRRDPLALRPRADGLGAGGPDHLRPRGIAARPVTRPRSGRAAAAALALAIGSGAAGPPAGPDALWRHRNLGKAFYENPTTHAEAVAELKPALDPPPRS